jgi:threonine/homoserine/homoserine lactone efflux protein
MRPEQTLAFVLFSIAAAATPGPSNTMLTATGAQVGLRRGLPALLGVGVGMGLLMFVVAFGLGAVILENPLILTGLKWCGAAFLCWLAWQIANAGRAGAAAGGRPVGFIGATAFQWTNPKSWLVSASAAATFLDQGAGNALTQSAAFGLTFLLVSLPCCLPWLACGAALQRWLRADRARRAFNFTMAAVLVGSVLLFIL